MTRAIQTAMPTSMLDQDECWTRFAARDHGAEGAFVACVLTTRIFCRPGCPARMPFRHNVRFLTRTAEAMTAGFRPCRRCLPLRAASDVGLVTVTALVRIIEDAPAEMLDLKTLAAKAGYSPSHFQRHSTTIVGLLPRAYHAAVRAKIYRRALKEEPNATAALTHAGCGSTSRVAGTHGPLGGLTPK